MTWGSHRIAENLAHRDIQICFESLSMTEEPDPEDWLMGSLCGLSLHTDPAITANVNVKTAQLPYTELEKCASSDVFFCKSLQTYINADLCRLFDFLLVHNSSIRGCPVWLILQTWQTAKELLLFVVLWNKRQQPNPVTLWNHQPIPQWVWSCVCITWVLLDIF